MKTLVCMEPGRLEYGTEAMPALQKDRALIRIKRVGICGTDLHAFEGTQPYFDYPRILGHELSGEVVEADGAPGFRPGTAVTVIPYFHCGNCIACRSGKPNCCVHLSVCGVHCHGGLREYLSVPASALVRGEGLGEDELALVEPLAIGAHGVRRACIRPGEWVLVIGAGPIGLGTMEFARMAGGRVIALDINEKRLDFCRQQLRIAHTINGLAADTAGQLMQLTNGDMPTVVIDATGNGKAIRDGFGYLAHGGRYVLIGLQKEAICFSHPEFHKREATLMSSRNATRPDFEQVIGAIQSGAVVPARYITHRVPFGQAKAGFDQWLKPGTGVVKAMVEMD